MKTQSAYECMKNIIIISLFMGALLAPYAHADNQSSTAGGLTLSSGNINLTASTSSSTGNITKDGFRYLHNFGTDNLFLGVNAGNFTMTGIRSVGIGDGVLASNIDGDDNTAVGYGSLGANTGGYENTAMGSQALTANTTGASNTAVGVLALTTNTTGASNTAMGSRALTANTTGAYNTAVGLEALTANTTGLENTAVGVLALTANTTGSDNTAVGLYALGSNQTGTANTAIGVNALRNGNVAGSYNTAVGVNSLGGSSGDNNTALGFNAGQNIITGTNNIAIGRDAGVDTGARTNCILIGTGVTASAADNQIRIGFGGTPNTSCFIDGIRGATTGVADAIAVLIDSSGQLGTVSSSRRYKENIETITDITGNFMQLRPVSFNYKKHTSNDKQYGLIAEEVEALFPELVVYNKDGEVETIKYHLLYALLIKMIQENRTLALENRALIEQLQQALLY